MSEAMVSVHREWDALLAQLGGVQPYRFLANCPRRLAQGVLAAPLAIARWIAEREPALAAREALRVLVIGAERLDAVDEGRWYQLLPHLLGVPLRVHVTLVGESLERFESPLIRLAPALTAQRVRSPIGQFAAAGALREYDLAILFHPGLQKHRGWLQDGSLAGLIASGVPLLAASFGFDEFEVERWVLECYGFGVAGDPLDNPFYVDLGDAQSLVHWGRALWRWDGRLPAANRAPDAVRLERLEQLSRMVLHSMSRAQSAPAPPGQAVELRSSHGKRLTLLHLFDGFLVPVEGGPVRRLRAGGLEEMRACEIPRDALRGFAEARSELERALLAAQLKARYLLPYYPPLQPAGEPFRIAADMHRAMRARIDALFRSDA